MESPGKGGRFQPGVSGNPAGRPRSNRPFRLVLSRLVQEARGDVTKLEMIAENLIAIALSNEPWAVTAIKEIRNTLDGLPVQQIDLKDGRFADPREVSDRELIDIATAGSNGASGQKNGETKPDSLH